jgi:hypothetical protein
MAQTYTILSETVHGVPSGNYDGSSQDWASDPVEAADYYRGRGSSTQTVTTDITGFVGSIVIEATLDTESDQAHWFELTRIGDSITPTTDRIPATIPGNFVWLRARIELFDSGTINFITVTY